ncbi:Atrial natriuretic peptide receptor 2 [Acipenser ruthenus]|uniref:Atrial natriuretic peptide receptor 2 n=1 Tax=Acipenser ruthenus TaxID=7906 RepID=A0A662YMB5_ACIRT|nr:Atrial natriuretic peptide receptor 2 [Acipenser ruthenus]
MAVMLPNNYSKYPWALPRVTPAIHMANEAIQKDDRLLKGYNITVVTESTEDEGSGCSQTLAQINAVDLKLYTNPDVFVGPGCVYSAASVGRFATHWKLPLITAWAPAYGFAKKDEYKTIVRTGPSTTKLGEFANYVHSYFNWTSRAVIIYHDIKTDDRPYYFLIEGIYSILELENITVGAHLYPEPQKIDYKEIVQHIKNSGRKSLKADAFRGPNKPWQNTEDQWHNPLEVFKTVFVITYREPNNQEYLDFQKKLHARAKQDYNVSLEYSLVDFIAGCFYDGVMLYAKALNETLAEGGSQKDGIQITQRMRNQKFWDGLPHHQSGARNPPPAQLRPLPKYNQCRPVTDWADLNWTQTHTGARSTGMDTADLKNWT